MAGAMLSGCGRYRYSLRRLIGDAHSATVLFIMLNPSTADAETDDPTIRRCMGFAASWGMGRMDVVNLWPVRATDPREMRKQIVDYDPIVASVNRAAIAGLAETASLVVAAWGGHVKRSDQAYIEQIVALVTEGARKPLYALGFTAKGHPRHPLMLPRDADLVLWKEPDGVHEA